MDGVSHAPVRVFLKTEQVDAPNMKCEIRAADTPPPRGARGQCSIGLVLKLVSTNSKTRSPLFIVMPVSWPRLRFGLTVIVIILPYFDTNCRNCFGWARSTRA